MKRGYWVGLALVGLICFKVGATIGNQYNWGSSTGAAWVTPDDTKTLAGAALQIGSNGGAQVQTSSVFSFPLGLPITTVANLKTITPPNTGYISVVTGGQSSPEICISTGVLSSQWAIFQASAPANLYTVCS